MILIGFFQYGYQLIKKYDAKMRAEGSVGVFVVSVTWALVAYLWNSGYVTAKLVRSDVTLYVVKSKGAVKGVGGCEI